jgi:hypothetical protein
MHLAIMRDLFLKAAIKVLHLDWLGEIGLERVVDVLARQFLKSRAGGVEVPVVVVEVHAGKL